MATGCRFRDPDAVSPQPDKPAAPAFPGVRRSSTTAAAPAPVGRRLRLTVIGGQLNAAGANARLGTGQYLVAEADESDGSFLLLSPVIAVVTNIDADHMETYEGDFNKLRNIFVAFFTFINSFI